MKKVPPTDDKIVTIIVDEHVFDKVTKKQPPSTEEQPYDPYDHGNKAHPINYWGAVVHMVTSTIGTGILLLPFAFSNVGCGLGVFGLLVIGLVYVNNLHTLLFTEYELCKKLQIRNLTYIGVVEKSFEFGPKITKRFSPLVKSLLYLNYGVPLAIPIYLIIIADNINNVYEFFFHERVDTLTGISCVIVPITLLCLIPKLKFLVPLSIVSNVFVGITTAIILLYSFSLASWEKNATFVQNVDYLPTFFAIVLQSLISTGMVLPLKNEMSKPKNFGRPSGVLNAAFTVLIFLYGCFGLVGFLNYGETVNENILSDLPRDNFVTVIVYILLTLALCVTCTLHFYVYYHTIWTNILQPRVSKTKFEQASKYILRISISFCAYFMAIAVPDFSLITSIVGTIGIIIEIGLPSVLQLLVLHTIKLKHYEFTFFVFKNVVIMIFSVVMFTMSCITCVSSTIDLYREKPI